MQDHGRRQRGEDVVKRVQDHRCRARGGDDEVGDAAELKGHEAAATVVLGGKVMAADVSEIADALQVADDRQPPWR